MKRAEGSYTLAELSRHLGAEYRGDPDLLLTGLATLRGATKGQLSFLGNRHYARQLRSSQASAVIVDAEYADAAPCACLIVEDPYVAYARASQLFARDVGSHGIETAAIHPTAIIHEDACVADDVTIGPNCVIGAGVRLGPGVRIDAGCTVGADSHVGAGTRLYPGVTIYHEVRIGQRVILHSGVVVGADGFGFAFDGTQSIKIAQLGGVHIGDDVEVGAGTTIDRGALEDTVIGDGVKIDNQVQIAHNCRIGDGSVICGCSALAGSTELGKYCVIGGGVGIIGHLRIADRVTVSAMSFVSRSIDRAGVYSSGTLLQETREWKKNSLRLQHLDALSRRVKALENRLARMSGNDHNPVD